MPPFSDPPHKEEPSAAHADDVRRYRPSWLLFMPFLGRPPALTRRQWSVLGLVASASFFEQYDVYLFVLTLKQIQAGLQIPEAQLGLLGAVVRFGSLPAFLILVFADRIGRRRVLLFTIAAYTLLTAATAFAPDVRTFVILQFLARAFAVAESLLGIVVIAEEFDPAVRGWGIGALGAIQSCGAGLAALLFALIGGYENGWRALYLIGLGPLLILAYYRRRMPETERFVAHQRQRELHPEPQLLFAPLKELFRRYPRRFALLAVVVFIFAAAAAVADFFASKYLQDVHGWTPRGVGLLTVFAGAFAVVGNTFAGWLSDRIGRKRVTVGFLFAEAICAVAYYNAPSFLIVPLWLLMIFTLLGTGVMLAAYGAELFPTSYRSTAAGARVAIATVGASLGLLLESLLFHSFGSHWPAISLLASLTLITPLIVAFTFPETSGRPLEEIAPERR